MWVCPKCNAEVDTDFEVCWSCGRARDGTEVSQPELPVGAIQAEPPPAQAQKESEETARRVSFRIFRSHWQSWEELFDQAADFASTLGPGRLISISHSEDDNEGVVTVWFWH